MGKCQCRSQGLGKCSLRCGGGQIWGSLTPGHPATTGKLHRGVRNGGSGVLEPVMRNLRPGTLRLLDIQTPLEAAEEVRMKESLGLRAFCGRLRQWLSR